MGHIALFSLDHRDALRRVLSIIQKGGTVVVPTDTVYGIIADARDERAMEKIFRMKARSYEKPLSLFVGSVERAREYAVVPERAGVFLERVWPGAVTVVLRIKDKGLRIKGDTIGMRAPAHTFLLELLRQFGFPLAQTSANISGKPAARSFADTLRYFDIPGDQPDVAVDGGAMPGVASTVVDLTGGLPRILREGAVSGERIMRLWESAVE